jgi:predicted ABC-type ATPase
MAKHEMVGRLADGGHDLPQPATEDRMPSLDVLPSVLAELDAASLWINRGRDHVYTLVNEADGA